LKFETNVAFTNCVKRGIVNIFNLAFDNFQTMFRQIPRKWVNAYLLIILWYAINYIIGAVSEYQIFSPYTYVLWNGLYMYETVCILVFLTFLWANLLFRYKIPIQVAGHLFGLTANFVVMGSLSYFLESYMDGDVYVEDWISYMKELLSWRALRFHDQYIITVFIYYIIRYIDTVRKQESEKIVLAIKNKEMQMSLLKSQINPHFLFNTLNSISTLIHFSKDKARKMITQLSDMFRYAMDSYDDQLVELTEELHFIDNYIRIQQVRFEERLTFVKEIEEECMKTKIPPMILQPLIENAVKYGIGPKDEGGVVKIIAKRIVGGGVYFEVRDNGLGVNAPKVLDGSSSRIGMKNSEKRLQNIYGPTTTFNVVSNAQGYKVSFIILNKKTNNNEYVLLDR